MSAIAPPPLPDLPTAPVRVRPIGYASASPGAAGGIAPRPVGSFTRMCLHAPLPVLLMGAAVLLLKQYGSGADFRHDSLHQLVRFFDVLIYGGVAGATLVTWGIILACTWRRLERAARQRMVSGAAAALAAGVLSVGLTETVFQYAKTRAYEAVNAAALAADCAAIAAAPAGPVGSGGERHYVGRDPIVPAYTRSLGPKYVRMTPTGVRLIMSTDLIPGIQQEGYFVPVAPLAVTPQAYAAQNGMTLISAQPPVFRYSTH